MNERFEGRSRGEQPPSRRYARFVVLVGVAASVAAVVLKVLPA